MNTVLESSDLRIIGFVIASVAAVAVPDTFLEFALCFGGALAFADSAASARRREELEAQHDRP